MNDFKLCKLFIPSGKDRWFVYYYFKYPDKPAYKRFRIFISEKFKTKASKKEEALRIIEKTDKKLKAGWSPFENQDDKHKSVLDALMIIIKIKNAVTTRKKSENTYNYIYNVFSKWVEKRKLSNLAISNFTRKHAFDYMDYCLNERRFQALTYNNMLTFIRSMFQQLVKREYIDSNPFDGIDRLKEPGSKVDCFSYGDLKIIDEKLPDYNYGLFVSVQLIFHAYIRISEMVRLKVGDFNLERRIIHIRPDVSKNMKSATIGIHEELYNTLFHLHLENKNPELYLFSKNLLPGESMVHSNRFHDAWRKFCKEFGITKTLYKLKHTSAGMCVEAGVNIRDLQLQMRHSSLEMTQIYLDKFKQVVSADNLRNFPNLSANTDENTTPIIEMERQKAVHK